jgi:isoamylase
MQAEEKVYNVTAGVSFPIGTNITEDGVNFCLFSKHATSVDLLLFNHKDDIEPEVVFQLTKSKNKTYHYWHICIKGITSGQLYGYRIHGPYEPEKGHRFDPHKVILDPYAKAVSIPKKYNRKAFAKFGHIELPPLKSVLADLSTYDWEHVMPPKRPFSRTVIYEMHVGGFTKRPNSGVDPKKRGTFLGLIEKIPYLLELGITAVEFLPVFQFDEQDAPDGLTNYWGYSPISFFAPHQGYSSNPDNPLQVLDDFRDMVKAFHKAGLEVLLDVVFNHSSENDEKGPTYTFRGIDNSIYYFLEEDRSKYKDYSGTGNTMNANQSIVRRMISSSLHFWVRDMHVDGFRFDLASILSRDERGNPIENPPILWDIESDPVLAGTKLIAEAWDAAGLYQVGSFTGDSWKEWNGRFRDDIRSFLRGDKGKLGDFVTRLIGSPDIYAHRNRGPEQSINFVTCHDGFTLHDLVSYNYKHNLANKENNRDGNNENYSWNFGVEGPTDDETILTLRRRQLKNFHAINILSVGVPMILMGDEVCHSQKGNNNAYCQDNELTWFDWDLTVKNKDVYRFVQLLIQRRTITTTTPQEQFSVSLIELLKQSRIIWHGVKENKPNWNEDSQSIAVTTIAFNSKIAMHYMVNACQHDLEFEIPQTLDYQLIEWKRWLDTSLPSPEDICPFNEAKPFGTPTYKVKAHSLVVLTANLK